MAATDVEQIPKPEIVAFLPPAPTKMKPTSRTVKPVPVNFELDEDEKVLTTFTEMDSMAEMFSDIRPGKYNPDPLSALERVFYDEKTEKLYKLYDDGTWDFVIVRENQL